MDREASTKKMKDLKEKAKKARREGKKELAASFGSGSKRLQRRLARTAPKTRRKRGKKDD